MLKATAALSISLAVCLLTYTVIDLRSRLGIAESRLNILERRTDATSASVLYEMKQRSDVDDRITYAAAAHQSEAIGLVYRMTAAEASRSTRRWANAARNSPEYDRYVQGLIHEVELLDEGTRAAYRPVAHMHGRPGVPDYIFEENLAMQKLHAEAMRQLERATDRLLANDPPPP